MGIVNNRGGYEIFPRRSKGGFESTPPSSERPATPSPSIEGSPYVDDTGDIENRGSRPPRRRRRP
jgi:hypothetical protein